MFLLVPAYPGSPGQKAVKWLCVYVCVLQRTVGPSQQCRACCTMHCSREVAGNGEDSGDEDFSHGVYSFLRRVHDSRQARHQQTTPLTADNVYIEHRLVAAATFEKTFV